MILGFIGTVNIVSDVVAGISKSKISYKKILVSPRNKNKAKNLKRKYKRIAIAKDNQAVKDNSNWIFIGTLPSVDKKILQNLKYKKNQTVISIMSTIDYTELKRIVHLKIYIVKSSPMPPISLDKGPVAMLPKHKKVKNFFNKIGTTIEIKDEKSSKNFWTISGTMASFYELLNVLTNWLIKKKINKQDAQKYVTHLYSALAQLAARNTSKSLKYLVEEQTPGGLNWQGVNELRKSGYYKLLEKSLKNIHKRL